MKFILNKNILEIENPEDLYSGSINYFEIDVEFDETWDGLTKEAIMIREPETDGERLAVINNKICLNRKLDGKYFIGFIGYTIENGEKIYQISTNLKPVFFFKGAGQVECKEVEELPSPTEWEKYISEIQKVINEANNLNIELEDNILTITRKDGTSKSQNVKGDDYVITDEDYEEIEEQVKTDIQPLLNDINKTSDNALEIAKNAENIAKGKSQSIVKDTWAEMEQWLKDVANKGIHNVGDNLYIKEKWINEEEGIRQPDYWITEVLEEPNELGYYYEISDLGVDHPDLTDFLEKDEIKEKYLLITYENGTTETVKLVVYK